VPCSASMGRQATNGEGKDGKEIIKAMPHCSATPKVIEIKLFRSSAPPWI